MVGAGGTVMNNMGKKKNLLRSAATRAMAAVTAAALVLFFLFVTLEPRVERYKIPCALNTSPPRNHCTFLSRPPHWYNAVRPNR